MAVTDIEGVEVLSPEEGMKILDAQARRYLGISGADFMQRWDAGEYAADPDQPKLIRLAMLIPLAR